VKNVLVTGANGQLGKCLDELSLLHSSINFVFTNSQELDITKKNEVSQVFESVKFDYCINCAAYTAVDKAEKEQDKARSVNVNGAINLAEACCKSNTTLIHISTDFVFDGKYNQPYNETDKTNPLSVYGKTKLDGELKIQEVLNNYFIIRTSWLYSEYGANFMKTMLRLGKDRTELSVVGDQIGTPTYAKDLAEVLLKIVLANEKSYGVYHYSNEGITSWYDFAKEIFAITNSIIKLNKITTPEYPTPAVRPQYSVLDKEKIVKNLTITTPNWKQSLKKALGNLKD
jgi:dTDP-4-dehydrorhamnose reductase